MMCTCVNFFYQLWWTRIYACKERDAWTIFWADSRTLNLLLVPPPHSFVLSYPSKNKQMHHIKNAIMIILFSFT